MISRHMVLGAVVVVAALVGCKSAVELDPLGPSLGVDRGLVELRVGDSLKVNAFSANEQGRRVETSVTWMSRNGAIARISGVTDSSVIIVAVSPGETGVDATRKDHPISAGVWVRVVEP